MDMNEFEAAVKRRHRTITLELGPRLNKAMDESVIALDLEQRRVQFSVNIAQNVLKDAMAVVARLSIPFTLDWIVELAARLAVYAITLAPRGDQDVLTAQTLKAIPRKLAQYNAQGMAVAETEWKEG